MFNYSYSNLIRLCQSDPYIYYSFFTLFTVQLYIKPIHILVWERQEEQHSMVGGAEVLVT